MSGYEARRPLAWIVTVVEQLTQEEMGLAHIATIEDLVIITYLGQLDSPDPNELSQERLLISVPVSTRQLGVGAGPARRCGSDFSSACGDGVARVGGCTVRRSPQPVAIALMVRLGSLNWLAEVRADQRCGCRVASSALTARQEDMPSLLAGGSGSRFATAVPTAHTPAAPTGVVTAVAVMSSRPP